MIETIGKLFCLYVGLKLAHWAYQMTICFAPWVKPIDFSTFGKWTVITGATDGIGKEYAKQVASQGQNLVIVGRNSQKLAATKSEIEDLIFYGALGVVLGGRMGYVFFYNFDSLIELSKM